MTENTDVITNPGDCQQIVIDNLNREVERLTKLLLKIKPMLSEWDTPMDILAELDELTDSNSLEIDGIKKEVK